jgi:hypothetical protein
VKKTEASKRASKPKNRWQVLLKYGVSSYVAVFDRTTKFRCSEGLSEVYKIKMFSPSRREVAIKFIEYRVSQKTLLLLFLVKIFQKSPIKSIFMRKNIQSLSRMKISLLSDFCKKIFTQVRFFCSPCKFLYFRLLSKANFFRNNEYIEKELLNLRKVGRDPRIVEFLGYFEEATQISWDLYLLY